MHLPTKIDIISILLPFSESSKEKISFIIDTGSMISLIKISQIANKQNIQYNKIKILKGVSGDTIQTIGSITGTISFDNNNFQHEFYLVPDYLNFGSAYAILGLDFLSKNDAIIDTKNKKVTFKNNFISPTQLPVNNNPSLAENCAKSVTPEDGSLPINRIGKKKKKKHVKKTKLPVSQTNTAEETSLVQNVSFDELALVHDAPNSSYFVTFNTDSDVESKIKISAGTEQIIEINVEDDEEKICLARNISDKLIVSNCIIKPSDGKAKLGVANISEDDVYLSEIDLELVPLKEYSIMSIRADSINRIEQIYDMTKIANLNKQERQIVLRVISDYSDVFYVEGDTLSYTPTQMNDIQTFVDSAPVNVKPYRLPMVQREEINRQVKEMLNENIIELSNSVWNSPLLCVKKKAQNGKEAWRVVVDFRRLNNITVGFAHPIPDIGEILMQLGKCKYFSKIDLKSGFHQILLKPEDRMKTAFTVNNESYQYVRSPFGLKNLPAQFCMLMKTVMAGLSPRVAFSYIDDILVTGYTMEEHEHNLRIVLDRLRLHNLKAHPEKCEFFGKEMIFLGHLITEEGIKPNPSLIKKVVNFPVPKTQKQVKSFVALVNFYRKFIPNFSDHAKSLNNLLKKNIKFKWDDKCEYGFRRLIQAITSEPILQYPDFSKQFTLTCDASDFGIGSVLSQEVDGSELPIAFASRQLNKAERNYSVIEKELLAIVWSVKHFHVFLWGKTFRIFCDQKPISYLFNILEPTSRLLRWRLKLEEYNYKIIYKPGKYNVVADALSRIPVENDTCVNVITRSATKSKEQSNIPVIQDTKVKRTRVSKRIANNTAQSTDFSSSVSNTNQLVQNTQQTQGNCEIASNVSDKNAIKLNTRDVSPLSDCTQIIANNPRIGEYVGEVSHYDQNTNMVFFANENATSLPRTNDNIISEKILFKKIKNTYFFYMLIKNELTHDISYESIITHFAVLREFLLQNNVNRITISNAKNVLENMDILKIKQILAYVFKPYEIEIDILMCSKIVVIEPMEQHRLISEYHNSLVGGHLGIKKSILKMGERYYWRGMARQIKKFIRKCPECQKNKHGKQTRMPLQIFTTPKKPFDVIAIDIVGPMPTTVNDNKYFLSVQCNFSKYIILIPLVNQEANTVAKALAEKVLLIYGLPRCLFSDQGTNFQSKLFKRLCNLLRIKQIRTTPFAPWSNGSCERVHRGIKEALRTYVNKDSNDWDAFLPHIAFCYNSAVHSATKYTPYELVFGQKAEIPISNSNNYELISFYDDYVNEFKNKHKLAIQIARENIISNKNAQKTQYDKHINPITFKKGDLVLIRTHSQKKLSSLFHGPYEVLECVSNTNTKVMVKSKPKVLHNNNLKLFVA